MDLQVRTREKLGKAVKTLRKQGLIPAELYGKKVGNLHLAVSENEFNKLFEKAGESTIVQIILENGENRPALIHDIDRNPITRRIRHADFYQINMTEKISVKIPISFIGEAPAVKKGGVLVKALQEIEVESLPQFLPHALEASLNVLNEIGDSIHLKEIKVDENVKIIGDPATVVATVTEPTQEEVEEAPAAEMPAETAAPAGEKQAASSQEENSEKKPAKK